jgi:predicted amidophosphoribosyltransferase
MTQLLRTLSHGVDVRELIVQSEAVHEARTAQYRPGPNSLYHDYEIDESLIDPIPSRIAVVDDVLTTGAHFRALKKILQETFPEVPVIGLFLARRVPGSCER